MAHERDRETDRQNAVANKPSV